MLYLSQILNSKVTDSTDQVVGRLHDVLVRSKAGIYSPLGFLLIKGKDKKEFCVPYEFVENLSREEITLKKIFSNIPNALPEGDYLYLDRDVLDQQIVDVGGARVVRVNDLKLGLFEEKMCVLGIDISVKGLLRRLGLAWLDFKNFFVVNLIDWRKSQPVRGALKLDTISRDLTRLHPADLANIIEDLSVKQGTGLMKSLDAETAAQVIEEVDPSLQKTLVTYLGPEKAAQIIQNMSVDEIVDLMQMLPKEEAKKFLSQLQNGKLKKVQKLITYEEDTAGGLMTTDFMSGLPDWTVEYAIAEVKRLTLSMRSMLYIYVTDEKGTFIGAVSLRRLLTADSRQKLGDLLKRLPPTSTLHIDQKLGEIIDIMTRYNLYTAAVLDEHEKIVGMVTIDDVMRCLKPKA